MCWRILSICKKIFVMLLMSCYHVCNAGFTISCQCAILAHLYQTWALCYLTLLMMMNYFFKGYTCHINSYFGKEKMYMLFMEFRKCVRICFKTYWDFWGSNPNAMSFAYAIVKTPHDELSICCITFACV
jgi:hypothetical protein